MAGVTARRPRSVKVWVSLGKDAATIPDLTGQTERTAEVRVRQDGLVLASVTEIQSADYQADTVVAQAPAPGTRGDTVSILVNRGARSTTYVMPDLIGVDGERSGRLPPRTRISRGGGWQSSVSGLYRRAS